MRRLLQMVLTLATIVAPMVSVADSDAPLSYDGKVVLVTGSTDGLGRALALSLAAQGAHVIVHGRNAARGQAVVDEITAAGKGSARFIAADFASLQAVRAFAETMVRDHEAVNQQAVALATRLGRTGAARAVGLANGSNPIGIVVPCHRVIGANGTLTGYAGGIERKQVLLDLERGSLF